MRDSTRHKLKWGWLRLFLAFVQMSAAASGVGALLAVGLSPVTRAFVIVATAATISSRLLYRGRPDPRIKQDELTRKGG